MAMRLSSWTSISRSRLTLLAGVLVVGMAFTGCKDKNDTSSSGGSTNTASSGSSGGSSSASGDTIVIGEYGSMTGSEADFGKQTDDGIKLAIEDVNSAGGLDVGGKKYKIQLEVEDDQSDTSKAETAVKRLIDEKNVTAVLGEVASSRSLAGGKVCQEKGVPMISPSSTNIAVTQNRDYVFRVCFLDSYQAAVVARFAHDGLNASKVAIFTNKGQAYSVGFSDEFKKAFTRYGGQVVAEQSYSATDQDFRGPLTAIKAANPQAILVPGYYSDAASIAKQARDLGITVPLLGGDGWDSQQLITLGGDAVNGCYFSNHLSIKDPNPKVQDFVKSFRAKNNHDPGALTALGYDAAKILFDAIGRAKSTDKKAIRDAIASTKDFDGVTGKITINSERNADKSAVIIAVKNKEFDYQATVPDPEKALASSKP